MKQDKVKDKKIHEKGEKEIINNFKMLSRYGVAFSKE